MAFQTATTQYPAPAVEGDWASDNPAFSMLTPNNGDPTAGGYTAWTVGVLGAFVGRFAWCNTANGLVTSANPGVATTRIGFIHRDQPVVITPWLGATSMSLYSGQEVDVLDSGDVWCRFPAGATIGQKVYASYADGSATAAATGTPTTVATVTATTTNASPNLTVVAGGTLVPGQPISGTGIPAGTFIVSVAGATAVMSANATASNAGVTITQTTNFETRWTVDSTAAAGDVAKISTRG